MFLFTNRAPGSAAQQSATDTVPFAKPLRQASETTGVSFDYLVKTAERESRFNPQAKASTSSASGLFQFVEQTWLGVLKQDGAKLGLANEAAAITSENGRFTIPDPAQRQRILALRDDPATSAVLAGAFAAKNGQQLKEAFGRAPSDGELYIAHFLGASGAKDLIGLAKSNPDAKAVGSFREAAAANRSVFFDRDGRAKTIGEVYTNLTGTFGQNPVLQAQQTAANSDKANDFFRLKGEGKPLHGLFRSQGEPVAEAIKATWSGLGQRERSNADDTTRVAFFPSQNNASLVRTQPSPAVLAAENTPRAVTISLPQPRPVDLVPPPAIAGGVKRIRSSVPASQSLNPPLNLLRFVKAGSNP